MGNCACRKAKSSITIATLGIDNAGKSSILKCLEGGSLDNVTPTIGFASSVVKEGRFTVTLYDLGGGARIRDIWKNYLPEVQGVIYVIDGSDHSRQEETKEQFTMLIQSPFVQGKPILLLVNKQDVAGSIDEVEATEMLNLQFLVNKHKCPCRVDTCSATRATGKKADIAIRSGFIWLLDWIGDHYDILKERVDKDSQVQKAILDQQKKERLARLAKGREEREREENGHVNHNGDLNHHNDDADSVTNDEKQDDGRCGDPNHSTNDAGSSSEPSLNPATSQVTKLPPIKDNLNLQEGTWNSLPGLPEVSPLPKRNLPPVGGHHMTTKESSMIALSSMNLPEGLGPKHTTSSDSSQETSLREARSNRRRRRKLRKVNKTAPLPTTKDGSEEHSEKEEADQSAQAHTIYPITTSQTPAQDQGTFSPYYGHVESFPNAIIPMSDEDAMPTVHKSSKSAQLTTERHPPIDPNLTETKTEVPAPLHSADSVPPPSADSALPISADQEAPPSPVGTEMSTFESNPPPLTPQPEL